MKPPLLRLRGLAEMWGRARGAPREDGLLCREALVQTPVAQALLDWSALPDDFRALLALAWLAHERAAGAAFWRTHLRGPDWQTEGRFTLAMSPVARQAVEVLDDVTTRLDWLTIPWTDALDGVAPDLLRSDLWLLADAAIAQELQRRLRFRIVRSTPTVVRASPIEPAMIEVMTEVTLNRAPADVFGGAAEPAGVPLVEDYCASLLSRSSLSSDATRGAPLPLPQIALRRAYAARFCGAMVNPFCESGSARVAEYPLARSREAVPRAAPRVLALASDLGLLD